MPPFRESDVFSVSAAAKTTANVNPRATWDVLPRNQHFIYPSFNYHVADRVSRFLPRVWR